MNTDEISVRLVLRLSSSGIMSRRKAAEAVKNGKNAWELCMCYAELATFHKDKIEGLENPEVNRIQGSKFAFGATEALAELCDEAAEAYLNEETLSPERTAELIKEEISECRLTPVICGSAKFSIGIRELADILVEFMPSAERRATDDLCGIIFKIEHDKTLGKVSHIRLFGGEISNLDEV